MIYYTVFLILVNINKKRLTSHAFCGKLDAIGRFWALARSSAAQNLSLHEIKTKG